MPPSDFGRRFFLKKCKTHEFSDNTGFCPHVRVCEMSVGRDSDGERKEMECRNVIFERFSCFQGENAAFFESI